MLFLDNIGLFDSNSKWLYRHLSIVIKENEPISLLGASGTGKSSLCRMIVGLQAYNEGFVKWFGKPIEDWIIFRQQVILIQNQTILTVSAKKLLFQYLSFQCRKHYNKKTYIDLLYDYISQLNLPMSIVDSSLSELSSGQRQILVLMVAFVLSPKIFLFDEATSAMSSDLFDKFVIILFKYMKHQKSSFIFVSHNEDQHRKLSVKKIPITTFTK